MDTLDPGKENTTNILQDAKEAWKAFCLNELHSIPTCSDKQQSSLQQETDIQTFVISKANSAGQMHRTIAEVLMYKRMGI